MELLDGISKEYGALVAILLFAVGVLWRRNQALQDRLMEVVKDVSVNQTAMIKTLDIILERLR